MRITLQIKIINIKKNCICINKAVSNNKEKREFIEVTSGYTQMSGINTEEYKYAVIAGINLILSMGGIYYCKAFIEKYKSISNL